MKCLNCNQEYADSSKFCPFCGTPASEAAPAPAALAPEAMSVDSIAIYGNLNPTTKKKGLIIGLIAALLVVVLGVGGFLLWYFVLSGDDKDTKDDKESSSQNDKNDENDENNTSASGNDTTNSGNANNSNHTNNGSNTAIGDDTTIDTPVLPNQGTTIDTPATPTTPPDGTVVSGLDAAFPNGNTTISFTLSTFDTQGTIMMSTTLSLRNNPDGSHDFYLQDVLGTDALLFHVTDTGIEKYVGLALTRDTTSDQATLQDEYDEAFDLLSLVGFGMTFDSSTTIYKRQDVSLSTGDAYSYAIDTGSSISYIFVDKTTGAWVTTADEAGNVIVSVSDLTVGTVDIPSV